MKIIDMMHRPPVTIRPDQTITDAAIEMERAGVGVLAVVDAGVFVGIVAVDDLLVHLAADLSDLATPVTAELLFSHHTTPVPAVVTAP